MFKKYILLLMFASAQLSAMNMNVNHGQRAEIGGLHREGFPGFFTSLRSPELNFMATLLSDTMPIIDRIPLIGHYQNEGTKKGGTTHGEYYNARVNIALIEHKPTALATVIPDSVRAALTKAGIHDLSTVEFYTNIVGDFAISDEKPFGGNINSCNVAFHPVLIRWRGTGTTHFNVPLQAGIFEAHGVSEKGDGIAFNRLGALDVNYHGAFSPDNGRFNYDSSNGLATFWVVGVYNGHAIVVFNIMALSAGIESLLLDITNQEHFDDVLRVMRDIPMVLSPNDVVVFTDAVRILERSSGHAVRELPVTKSKVAAPALTHGGHMLGGRSIDVKDPRELAYSAALRRHPGYIAEESTSDTKPNSGVDQSIIDDMAQAFMAHLQQNNIDEALSLLDVIEGMDLVTAAACRLALEEYWGS